MPTEHALQLEIDLLKSRIAETPDLYLQACHLLFFGHGIMPTATRLYQFVRKGSMTTVSEVVKMFWSQVREKSRVLVDNGGLPEEIRDYAGEALAEIWRRALMAAEASAAKLRDEAEQRASHLTQALETAALQIDQLERENTVLAQRQTQAETALQVFQQKLAASVAQGEVLERELGTQRQAVQESQQALAAARADFATELGKLQDSAQRAETRLGDAEKRAMLEIDKHRTQAGALQKQLDAARAQAQSEGVRAEQALTEFRERLARLQGVHDTVSGEHDRLRQAHEALQARTATGAEPVKAKPRVRPALRSGVRPSPLKKTLSAVRRYPGAQR